MFAAADVAVERALAARRSVGHLRAMVSTDADDDSRSSEAQQL
jgi:hypothetical protein